MLGRFPGLSYFLLPNDSFTEHRVTIASEVSAIGYLLFGLKGSSRHRLEGGVLSIEFVQ